MVEAMLRLIIMSMVAVEAETCSAGHVHIRASCFSVFNPEAGPYFVSRWHIANH